MSTQLASLTRHASNPVLSKSDVPYAASLVFNAGVTKWQGRYVMVFRNDYGFDPKSAQLEGTNLGLAFSDDGVNWCVEPEPCLEICNEEVHRAYDPRITIIDDQCYLCFAVDTVHGIRGAVAATKDFQSFEILSMSLPDNRNMVLFPEKINGKYVRLERPMPIYGRGGGEAFDLWLSDSSDLAYWGNHQLVLGSEQVAYCNNKIGPGAPPIKTKHGWLAMIHTVWKDENRPLHGWELQPWTKLYSISAVLLDLNDPSKVIGLAPEPLLSPQEPYEVEGYREAVFPTGMILEDTGEVKIYYGGADTTVCLATAHLDDLLKCVSP